MADRASSSRQKRPRCPRQNKKSNISYETSVSNLSRKGKETVDNVNQKSKQRPLNTIPGASSTVFDNTWPAYNWLRSGWIVEERVMQANDRLYRNYYDPLGQLYSARYAVEHIYANMENDPEQKDPEQKVPKQKDHELKVPEMIVIDE